MQLLLILASFLLVHCGSPLEMGGPKPSTAIPSQTKADTNPWFKIIVLDVGQGDATILAAPHGETALIDTGPPDKGSKAILSTLKDQSIEEIQNIFISHYHEDHIGGLNEVLSKLHLDHSKIIDKNNARVGQTISLGPVSILIEAANGKIGETFSITSDQRNDENNLSLGLAIQYGRFRYFTDGDLPGGGGQAPYQTIDLESHVAPLVGDVDIILVPHHGSHTSSNETFLNILKPENAVISLGNDNDFFHPHPSVIERLKSHGVKIYVTEKGWLRDSDGVEIVNGSICIITNGETYLIKPYALDKCASPPS